ncbi:glycosyltransferase family 4 protein [Methanonatronarchaeum sp. AMET-Sl]|uniref:glycosyltransferase family 4 protein n=1 Tax=Methanonatronarchaeum sp. AMET-Sl TaxID=3037654 RepID=UPI00244E2D27|nr:glycosyltransferase family 4 protein [Methanonatronarchaeum sp. AMET-Sl]WGI16646.1 glycosyltransferase family 4 protein [Methanonatronarchaeum sp. AMET-Sl]
MKVCIYLEMEGRLDTSGIGVATKNQRKALRRLDQFDLDLTKNPWSDYDILHLNTIGPKSLFHLFRAKRKNKPVVLHSHTTGEDFKGSFMFSDLVSIPLKKYLGFYYTKGDVVLCPSKYTKQKLFEYNVNNPIVVSNGVDLEKYSFNKKLRKEYRDRYGLTGTVVFAVGSPFERKGVETFIEVAKTLPEYSFVWFGPLRKLQKKSIRKLIENPPDNVKFTGKVDNVVGAYSAGDIFFLPSYNENQGLVVLEAAACERPLILRDIPGFKYCRDKTECLKGESEQEFKKHIDSIARNKDLRDRLVSNGLELANRHSLENTGEKLIKIYKEVLNSK